MTIRPDDKAVHTPHAQDENNVVPLVPRPMAKPAAARPAVSQETVRPVRDDDDDPGPTAA